MKIKTTTILKTLKGEDLMNDGTLMTVGDTLGTILVTADVMGKFKLYTLAQKFATDEEIEVDEADFSLIKKAIEDSKVYSALVLGQLLQILETK